MKKVRIITSFSAPFGSYIAGEVVDLADADADELIACGYCKKEDDADAVQSDEPTGGGAGKPSRRKAPSAG